MKLSKPIPALVILLAGFALANESAPVLPKQFGGWQISGSSRTSTDPAIADPVNAAVLKEYGFNGFESATYTRDDGRKLTLKTARFGDASGAYGAYTYYKIPLMRSEKIGDGAASMNISVPGDLTTNPSTTAGVRLSLRQWPSCSKWPWIRNHARA